MTHFLVYRETQHNSVTHRKILRETQNILRHSESHQQVFTVLESSGIKMRFPFLTKTGFYIERRRPEEEVQEEEISGRARLTGSTTVLKAKRTRNEEVKVCRLST